MKIRFISGITFIILLWGQLMEAFAQCAYIQPGNNWEDGYLSVDNVGSFNQIIADDIFVPAGQCWTISSVVLSYATSGTSINLVNVFFYNDAGGIPGSTLASFPNVGFTATPNGNPFGLNAFLLNITLTTPVTLCGGTSGTRYWFGSNARGAGATNTYWEVHGSVAVTGLMAHVRDFNAYFCPSATWYPINASCFIGPDANNAQPVFTLNITSGAPPFLSCPGDINVNTAAGQCEATATFSTPTSTCQPLVVTSTYTGGSDTIPDNDSTGVTLNHIVTDFSSGATLGGLVSLTRVCFQITHTWVGDLVVTLTAPNGSTVVLMDRPGVPNTNFGCSGENVDVCIIPGTGNEIENAPCGNNPAYSGNFTAHGGANLSSINNGGPANGTWQLLVSDRKSGDVGQVDSWSLEFTTSIQITQTAGLPSGSSFPIGITTNIFTATDAFGNTSSCSFNVTVIDNQPPQINCPQNISVNVDPGQCNAGVNYSAPTATDNCTQITTASYSGPPISIPDNDINGVNSTITTTQFGNLNMGGGVILNKVCFQITHTWVGDLVVTLTAPNGTSITLMDRPGVPNSNLGCSGDNVDVCIILGTGNEIENAPCGNNPAYSGNFTAHGGANLSSINNGGPANGTWTLNVSDRASLDVGNIIAWSLEFTRLPVVTTLTAGLPSGATFPVGTTIVTYTATDGSGNTATCSFNVTVVDNEAPALSCPGNMTVANDPAACTATVTYTTPVGMDNCSGQLMSIPYVGAPVNIPDNNPSGATSNLVVTSFGSGVTLGGAVNLNKVCFRVNHTWVGDIIVRLIAPNGTIITLMDRPGVPNSSFGCAGDNVEVCIVPGTGNEIENAPCGNNPAYSGDFTAHGGVNLTAINNGGPANGTWRLVVADVAGGDVGTIQSWSLEFQTSVQTIQVAGLPSGANFPVGITVNTFQSTDAFGNVSQCSFDVEVLDTEAPQLSCISDITISTDPGSCEAVLSFSPPFAVDNCNVSYINQIGGLPSGSSFPLGITTIEFEAGDASNNTAQCTFNVIVQDMEPPAITCPPDITVSNDPGECHATVFFVEATATDNCGVPIVVQTGGLSSGADFPVGTTTVTYQATDASGNTSVCSFDITVNDTELPEISCPNNIIVNNDVDSCSAVVMFANPAVSDNCPGVQINQTSGLASGSAFLVGTTTVTFLATDAFGNTAACSFTVSVVDTQLPEAICPSNITLDNDNGVCGATVLYQVVALDNCIGAQLMQTNGLPSGSLFSLGTTVNTFMVSDASGNTSSCSFTVTVNPNPVPAANAGPDVSICQGASATLTASGGVSYTWSNGVTQASITVSPAQTTTYVVTVSNVNGCTASDTVTVTVNNLPVISFTSLNPSYCVDGPPVSLTATPPGGSFSGSGVSGNIFNPSAAGVGTATITYTYTDNNGCTGTQTQTTEVEVCIGIAKNIALSHVRVYPNPFEEEIFIDIEAASEQEMHIRMTDLNGKEIYWAEVMIHKGNNQLMVRSDDMIAGAIYLLELTLQEGVNQYRLLKIR